METENRGSRDAPRRIGDYLMNILLVVLLAALFAQCALYMWQYARIRRTSSEMPFDMRMLSASSAEAYPDLEPALLMPEAMAIHDGTSCRAIYHTDAVVRELYGQLSGCLYEAMLRDPRPAQAADWQNAAAANYIYVQFTSELPYQVVFAFSAAWQESETQLRTAESYVGVREMLLSVSGDIEIREVLVRGTGGVFRFPLREPRSAAGFFEYPSAYAESFSAASLTDCGSYSVLRSEASFAARGIYASGGVSSLLTVNLDFLRFLEFNPDKLNYHLEQDGSYVYVESHGVLHAGNDEILYQASDGGGISVSSLNGGESGDIYAYLRVASHLISWLENQNMQYAGGDAELRLESVHTDGQSVTLTFGYRCDNIAIRNLNRDYGLTMVFTGGKVTEIRYRLMIVRRSLEERRVMLQDWYRRMLESADETPMRLLYTTDGSTDMIIASWASLQTVQAEEGTVD